MEGFLIGAGTVLLTQLLALGVEFLRSRWTQKTSKEYARETRGHDAANRILDLLDEGRKLYEESGDEGDLRGETRLYDLCHRIDREAVFIPDEAVRRRVGHISEMLWYGDTVHEQVSHSRTQVGFFAYRAGLDILGAFLRNEDSATVDTTYVQILNDYHDWVETVFEPHD